ncbi:MAG: hypothetical protein ACM3S5_07940 [Rhodospirillales bacterium]
MKLVRFGAIVMLQTAAAALLALQIDDESRLLQEANARYAALRSDEAVTFTGSISSCTATGPT